MDTRALSTHDIQELISEMKIEEYPLYIDLFLNDSRKGVQKIGKKLETKYKRMLHEKRRIEKMKQFENRLYLSGCTVIAGVDEVGRGPLAGPVVAAAVILPKSFSLLDVNDSKKLNKKKREELLYYIEKDARDIGIGIVHQEIIDEINILNASKLAMKKAVEDLKIKPEHVLVDAITIDDLGVNQTGIIKGDQKCLSIAAASIVAKENRDHFMMKQHNIYPQYDFINNKGYGTEKHYEGLRRYGLCPLHRRSFLKNFNHEF